LASAFITPAQAHADGIDVYTAWKADTICSWFNQHPQVSAVEPMFKAFANGHAVTEGVREL
jgi:hypothetical protein